MTTDREDSNEAVFEQLFRDYQQPILNYVYRLVGDGARAEDLTQEVFVKAYRGLSRLPVDANHRAWLYRIATNASYDYLRRRRLVKWLPLRERDRVTDTFGGLEHVSTQQDEVQRTLAKLPPHDRAVLILYSVDGYSTAEIGEILGTTPGAVKTRLFRARERFRRVHHEQS